MHLVRDDDEGGAGDGDAASGPTLRLWHTAGVLVTLSSANGTTSTFSWTNLIILLVVAAIFYPLQKKLRDTVSRRRKERWAEEDRRAEELRRREGGELPRDEEEGPRRNTHDPGGGPTA